MVAGATIKEVRRIFETAIELPAGERAEYLRRACPTETIRRRVEHMLSVDESGGWLDGSTPLDAGELAEDAVPAPSLPERLGRYTIRRHVATGGMGAVYEAEQEHPRRIVAIKVMLRRLAHRDAARRFHEEARILGTLRHPAIAQIHDAGVYREDGEELPYFVMEYVPGAASITEYAERERLGVRQRIELLIRVCEGVQHGHQKGVVHRDLKPDNILVDESGQPKIIDFGVARMSDAGVAATTANTNANKLVGTLAYMSPEQLADDLGDVDTRSDVYSLAAVLHELLAGRPPIDVRGLSVPEAVRALATESPARLPRIDAPRSDELRTIVSKGLERERDRRYQSAQELGQELRRYLDGEAILARPATLAYRLHVAIRRNRRMAAAIAVALLALAAGLVGSTAGFVQSQRRLTETLRVTQTLSEAFQSVEPKLTSDRVVSAKEILDEVARKIGEEGLVARGSLAEAMLRHTIGVSYERLGKYERAAENLRRALDIRLARLGETDPRSIETMYRLGLTYSRQQRFVESREVLSRITAHYEAGQIPASVTVGASLRMLGYHEPDPDRAVELCRESLRICREILGDENREVAWCLNNLAIAINRTGDLEAGLETHLQSLEMRRNTLGPDHWHVTFSLANVAAVLNELGRFDEAEPYARQAVELSRRIWEDDSMWPMVWLTDYADTLDGQGNHSAAEPLRRKVHRWADTGQGGPGRRLAAKTDLAATLLNLDRPSEAEPLLREAIGLYRRINDPMLRSRYADRMARAVRLLGRALTSLGRHEEAEAVMLDGYERFLGADDADAFTSSLRAELVALYEAWGKPDEAAAWRQ